MDNSTFTLTGFADEISTNPQEQVNGLLECGLQHLEVRKVGDKGILDLTVDEVSNFKQLLNENGIQVSCIGSPIGKVDVIADDMEEHFRRFQIALERARQFETRFIRIFSFYHKGQSAEEVRDAVFHEMERMVAEAEKAGLILLHENEKGIYGVSAQNCLDLLARFGGAAFQGIFDPANFVQAKEDPLEHCWPMLRKHITYFHIKDAIMETGQVVPAGQGDGGIPAILAQAKADGYQGFVSLEPHLGASFGEDGLTRFRVATEALRKIFLQM